MADLNNCPKTMDEANESPAGCPPRFRQTRRLPLALIFISVSTAVFHVASVSQSPVSGEGFRGGGDSPSRKLFGRYSFRLPKEDRMMGWIHVGKCGGTSLESILRYGCPYERFKINGGMCRFSDKYLETHVESTVSKVVEQTYHVEEVDFERFNSFLVSTRDPLNRTISAFLMHHPENEMPDVDHADDFVFGCFDTLEDFGMALGGKPTGPKTVTDDRDGSVHDCIQLAKTMILGEMGKGKETVEIGHLYWNYDSYLAHMPENKEIFATRLSHLWDDFITINTILGGSEDEGPQVVPTGKQHHKRDSSQLGYAVTNKLSLKAREYMCEHLVTEYELYFDILERAVNLSDEEVYETITLAKESCPKLFSGKEAFSF